MDVSSNVMVPTKIEQLSPKEAAIISQRTDYDLVSWQLKVTGCVAILNIFAMGWIAWVNYKSVYDLLLLKSWCFLMFATSIGNFIIALYFLIKTPSIQQVKLWRVISRLTILAGGIAWGSLNFLVVPIDIAHQYFLLFVLYAVISSFALGAIMDFFSAIISLSLLLIPPIIWPYIKFFFPFETIIGNPSVNSDNAILLVVYGVFMLQVAYLGSFFARVYISRGFILANANQTLEQRVQERTQDLEYQANHDYLTGLPNTRKLESYLENAVDEMAINKNHLAIFFFGLDKFKDINDSMTHEVGNALLKAIAKNIHDEMNKLLITQNMQVQNYLFARMWGDSFVIAIKNIEQNNIERFANAILGFMEPTFRLQDLDSQKQFPVETNVKLSISMGISYYPEHGVDPKRLLMNAETAMFYAKQEGRNRYIVYTSNMNADTLEKLTLMNELQLAVERNELILHYQPIVDLSTGRIVSVEALVRWMHPTKGLIPPLVFIPLAEQKIDLIKAISKWVIKQACSQIKIWHDLGYSFLKVAVNLSFEHINDDIVHHNNSLAGYIEEMLALFQIKAQFLAVELTENSACKHMDKAIQFMNMLKKIGVDIYLDDFGTGYSSLNYLDKFPIDKVKIDKSFITNLANNNESATIVSSIIEITHKLKLTALAEGVETKQQLDILQQLKCDLIQGFYFSKPIDAESVVSMLRDNRILKD